MNHHDMLIRRVRPGALCPRLLRETLSASAQQRKRGKCSWASRANARREVVGEGGKDAGMLALDRLPAPWLRVALVQRRQSSRTSRCVDAGARANTRRGERFALLRQPEVRAPVASVSWLACGQRCGSPCEGARCSAGQARSERRKNQVDGGSSFGGEAVERAGPRSRRAFQGEQGNDHRHQVAPKLGTPVSPISASGDGGLT